MESIAKVVTVTARKMIGGDNSQEKKVEQKQEQERSSDNRFLMSDPVLNEMAIAKTSSVPVLREARMLTETEVELAEQKATAMEEQVELQGRLNVAESSIFDSHCKISEDQFEAAERNVKRGLKARRRGATKFGKFALNEARVDYTQQNHEVQLAQHMGNLRVNSLGQEFEQAVGAINGYMEGM